MEPKEWAELWAAMKASPDQWIETTERMQDEMLNVLPPRAYGPSCFLMGEPDHDDEHGRPTYACFRRRRVDGRPVYEARYLSFEQFEAGEALKVEVPKLPDFPKAERYALIMREAFAHAQDRGRTDAGPLANAASLARILAHENKDSDRIASAFWTRVLQWIAEGN